MEEPGAGYCPWGRKESDTTERLHLTLFLVNTERALNWLSLLVPSHFSQHSANLYNILHLPAW